MSGNGGKQKRSEKETTVENGTNYTIMPANWELCISNKAKVRVNQAMPSGKYLEEDQTNGTRDVEFVAY